jgi:hypothetical protein
LLLLTAFSGCNADAEREANLKVLESQQDEFDLKYENEYKTTKFYELEFSSDELANWVSASGNSILTKTKKIEEYNYTLKYLPLDYLISNELKKSEISKKEYDSLKAEYEGMEYYEMRIQIDGFNDETAKYQLDDMGLYQQRIVYMSFAMQENLKLVTETGKEIPCDLFHFERTYAVAPYATFLMGFAKDKIGDAKEYTVIFDDNLFNKGLLKFNWEVTQLQNVPKLLVL